MTGPGRPRGSRNQPLPGRWLRTSEVAELLQVSKETVTRWAAAGKLPVMKTLGGHRRFPEAEILALLEKLTHTSEWDTRRLHP